MKRMKKVISLIMALVMVLAIAVPVMAEGTTHTITINNEDEGHIYEAYQIFTGELHGNVLSDIQWGSGITETGKSAMQNNATEKSAAGVAAELENETNAKLFAENIVKKGYLTTEPAGTSIAGNGVYTISGLAPGYYLIKDQDDTLEGKDTTYTEYMIKIVKDISIDPKDSEASFEKKVEDRNDSLGLTTKWQDSADYDIGDNVPFQLEATLPANVTSFDTYEVVFHDTLSAGLSYAADAKVFVDGHEKTTSFTISQQPGSNDTTILTISCDNVKALGATNNSKIRVNYTAILNENAVIGGNGNPNTAYLEYSNNPNDDGIGKTVDDKVVVFTYKVVINKVTADSEPLTGAEFKLEKKISGAERVVIDTIKAGNGSTFSFVGLDDGDYVLTETATPNGFNSIAPIEFTISATHDVESVEPTLLTLTGGDLLTGEVSTGILTGNVVNESGATLPETGGIGTTLFYVLGAILVLGAGVALVTRKRMS